LRSSGVPFGSAEHAIECPAQVGPRRVRAGRSGRDHQVGVRGQPAEALHERFAQSPPHAISHDGVAHATAHGDANARSAEVIGRHIQHQQRMRQTAWCSIANAAKLGGRTQPLLAFHVFSGWREARRSDSDDGQALAPAQAASLEHRATGCGQHAFEKAVLPSTWDALRLIGTLGHGARFLCLDQSGLGCLRAALAADKSDWREEQLPHRGEAHRANCAAVYQRTAAPVEVFH
jgi:hypothetical protein